MKLKTLPLIIVSSLAMFTAACQTTSAPATSSQQQLNSSDANVKDTLQAYTWSYQPQDSKKPIILAFGQDQLMVYAGCNRMRTKAMLENGQIKTGHMMSTMMACKPDIMKQEQLASSLFQDRNIPIELDTSNPDQPVLTVHSTDHQTYSFIGTATPETQYQGQGETIFLEVAPNKVPCVGVGPMQCMKVREITYNDKGVKTATGDWTLFYDSIKGYTHQDNQRAILRIKRYERKNPAADQSKYAYVHDLTVEQEQVK